ncbi:MAG: ABC transporter permease [Anaerolineales bacterium]|nr:ABC transporter permease [Anaerolineales bacterium]
MLSGQEGLLEIVLLTLEVTGAALLIACLTGIPAGAGLALTRLKGREAVLAVVYTGMGFPPVVIGLLVYLLLSRSGPLGSLGWLFTPPAMVVAQVILAFPLVAGLTSTSIASLDPEFRLQVRSLGATPRQEVLAMLHEARIGVVAAVAAGFGAIISEVGAAMLVGGNIAGQTRVLSTAVVLETRRGNFGLALVLGGILLALALAANVIIVRIQGGRHWWPR